MLEFLRTSAFSTSSHSQQCRNVQEVQPWLVLLKSQSPEGGLVSPDASVLPAVCCPALATTAPSWLRIADISNVFGNPAGRKRSNMNGS